MVDWIQRTNARKALFRKGDSKFTWEISFNEELEKWGENEAPIPPAMFPLFPEYKMEKVKFQFLKQALVSLRENLTQCLQ